MNDLGKLPRGRATRTQPMCALVGLRRNLASGRNQVRLSGENNAHPVVTFVYETGQLDAILSGNQPKAWAPTDSAQASTRLQRLVDIRKPSDLCRIYVKRYLLGRAVVRLASKRHQVYRHRRGI